MKNLLDIKFRPESEISLDVVAEGAASFDLLKWDRSGSAGAFDDDTNWRKDFVGSARIFPYQYMKIRSYSFKAIAIVQFQAKIKDSSADLICRELLNDDVRISRMRCGSDECDLWGPVSDWRVLSAGIHFEVTFLLRKPIIRTLRDYPISEELLGLYNHEPYQWPMFRGVVTLIGTSVRGL